MITLKEASLKYGIQVRTLQNWCKSGLLDSETGLHPYTTLETYYIPENPKNINKLSKTPRKGRPTKLKP